MFSVLHESTHHAISTDTRVNDALGHISVPFVAPYASFRLVKFIHIEHHRNTNEPKSIDPDAWTSEGPWWQLPFRWMTIDVWYFVFYVRRISATPARGGRRQRRDRRGASSARSPAWSPAGTAPSCWSPS